MTEPQTPPQLLCEWMIEHERTRSYVARKIERHAAQVTRYITGETKPSVKAAKAIEQLTEGAMPWEAWFHA